MKIKDCWDCPCYNDMSMAWKERMGKSGFCTLKHRIEGGQTLEDWWFVEDTRNPPEWCPLPLTLER